MNAEVDYVPSEAKQMYALGPKTEAAIREMFRKPQQSLFADDERQHPSVPLPHLELLSRALLQPVKWSDEQSTLLIEGVASKLARTGSVDLSLLSRWVLSHPDDAPSVLMCLDVTPPDEIEIRRVLSLAGSQKVVFLATWRLIQKEVVVKRLLDTGTTAMRELESFPINLSHHNIIETYRLQNSKGELFLVEHLLPEVLSDSWRAQGVQEAANLLHDVGAAIKYLHENGRAHGDIKPDNIGRRDGDFILLDFGICRPIDAFSPESTATGSLRTRAPELLPHGNYVDPTKVDVWALGATLFSVLVGRFPLIEPGEAVPRIKEGAARAEFERELSRRASEEWDKRVDVMLVPVELRDVLRVMLVRDPGERVTSAELLEKINRFLPAYLHGGDARARRESRFSPLEELEQLSQYVGTLPPDTRLPARVRDGFKERLKQLGDTPGFTARDQERAKKLSEKIGGMPL